MTYYHFRVIRKSDPQDEIYMKDLSYENLIQRAVRPYEEGKPIVAGGTTVPIDDLDRLMISKSEETAAELGEYARQDEQRSPVISLHGPSWTWSGLGYGTDITDDLIVGPPGGALATGKTEDSEPPMDIDLRKVFVAHGRDKRNRDAMFTFLRSIHLDPIEWSEARKATGRPMPYIGDILDKAFSMARAVVVLLTPDDEAKLRDVFLSEDDPPHEKNLIGQARPNVLFEAGMAMGRSPEHTILVECGKLRPFSDIAGLHVVRFDGESTTRQELAHRLQDAGCEVSLEGTDWHTAGDFEFR